MQLAWLPVAGNETPSAYLLPVLALAVGPAAILARIVRVEMVGVLEADFVRTARAKRLPPRRVYLVHALPNAVTAALTLCGLLLSAMVAGTVLVENVFAWPGLGTTIVSSILTKDYPVVQAIVLVYGLGVLLTNTVVDVPGIRVGHATRIAPGWLTGTTVVVAPDAGAVGGVDVRGAAPGKPHSQGRRTMSLKRKSLLAYLLAGLWLAAMVWAFWWYQARYLRPFDTSPTLFSGEHLQLPAAIAGPGSVRLVHFWDPACPCNVGNQQHLAELLARFAPLGVQFFAVQKPGSHGQLPATLQALRPLATPPGAEALPASPAVAIWDRQGRLAYFGPYSEGAVCSSANSFIEPVLQALIDGRPVQATQSLAQGCYCPWRADSRAPASTLAGAGP